MNATALYVSTCRYILQADLENSESWADLYRLLPYLRQSLSCCVCGALLDDPQGPTHSTCQHFVCRTCVGGKMLLKPSCSWCKDYGKFAEVRQLRILLSCYKKLCEYIAATPIARSLVGANGESNSTLTILQEGMAINAIHESFNMSTDKALNILDILAKANLEKGYGEESKSPGRRRGRRQGERSIPGPGASPQPLSVDIIGECGNPEVASPSSDSRLDGLSNGIDGSDHLEMSDDHQSFYSASVSNSDTPRIKIKRKHTSEHKSKGKKKKKKRDKDKERKFDKEQNKISCRGRGNSERKKRRHKAQKEIFSSEPDHDIANLQNGDHSSAEGETPKKMCLVISGHRAKLLKAGKTLPPISVCRCGTWNRHPGIYTCFGNRCPCYMEEKGCSKCKCKGCQNPFTENSDRKKHLKDSADIKRDVNGGSEVDINATNI